jgi:hypothetical protein
MLRRSTGLGAGEDFRSVCMSAKDDVQRLADEVAAYFRHQIPGDDLGTWIRQHFAPDIAIYNKAVGDPVDTELWLSVHSAENGYGWDAPNISLCDVLVGDDAFVVEVVLSSTRVGLNTQVPICLVCAVANGKIQRLDQYWSLESAVAAAERVG